MVKSNLNIVEILINLDIKPIGKKGILLEILGISIFKFLFFLIF